MYTFIHLIRRNLKLTGIDGSFRFEREIEMVKRERRYTIECLSSNEVKGRDFARVFQFHCWLQRNRLGWRGINDGVSWRNLRLDNLIRAACFNSSPVRSRRDRVSAILHAWMLRHICIFLFRVYLSLFIRTCIPFHPRFPTFPCVLRSIYRACRLLRDSWGDECYTYV